MYIEKLIEKDFEEFATLFNCGVSKIENSTNNDNPRCGYLILI